MRLRYAVKDMNHQASRIEELTKKFPGRLKNALAISKLEVNQAKASDGEETKKCN
jgi:hypothetical protein